MKAKAKVSPPKKKAQQPARNGRKWQRLYEETRKERNRLRKELAQVKKERDTYRKAVGTLMSQEPIEFTREEAFAQIGRKPSLEDLISELEAQGDT
jgi:hypothetical protein